MRAKTGDFQSSFTVSCVLSAGSGLLTSPHRKFRKTTIGLLVRMTRLPGPAIPAGRSGDLGVQYGTQPEREKLVMGIFRKPF